MKRGSIELPLFSCLIVTDGTRKMYLQYKNHIPDMQGAHPGHARKTTQTHNELLQTIKKHLPAML